MDTLTGMIAGLLIVAAAGFTLAGLLMRPRPQAKTPETQDDPFTEALARAAARMERMGE